jgi:hypothetical protein
VFDRAMRWISEQAAFLTVLAVLAAAFLYLIVQPGRWGRGSGVVAVSVMLAGLFRATLPTSRAGMLVVRSRVVDTVAYLVLGAVILSVDIRLHA